LYVIIAEQSARSSTYSKRRHVRRASLFPLFRHRTQTYVGGWNDGNNLDNNARLTPRRLLYVGDRVLCSANTTDKQDDANTRRRPLQLSSGNKQQLPSINRWRLYIARV